jgi:hypothetical protein
VLKFEKVRIVEGKTRHDIGGRAVRELAGGQEEIKERAYHYVPVEFCADFKIQFQPLLQVRGGVEPAPGEIPVIPVRDQRQRRPGSSMFSAKPASAAYWVLAGA